MRPLWVALVLAGLVNTRLATQVPAPAIEWEPWRPVGICSGVEYFVAVTRDDGRNDLQIKLKAVNRTGQLRATRFKAVLTSSTGEKKYREGGVRVGPGREADGASFNLGQPFEMPVGAPLPPRLVKLEFTMVETSNVETPPAYATPSTYLSDFVDYPKVPCRFVTQDFGGSALPAFMQLTNACYRALPRWIPACQDAVDEIYTYSKTAPESTIPCLKEWRQFQKCYEAYAYGPNPDPRPDCVSQVPRCNLK
jgi:hypothetical protein